MLLNKQDFPRVAIEDMNRVHNEEIDMLNEIQQLLVQRSEGKDIGNLLNERLENFVNHVQAHFAGEEQRMLEGQFPVYSVHKQEHDRVLAELRQHHDEWKKTGNSDGLEKYLLLVVPEWMVQHVSTMDFVTAQYLEQ